MSARRPSASASRPAPGPASPVRRRHVVQGRSGEQSSGAPDESDDGRPPQPQYDSADDDDIDDGASLSSLLSAESIAAPLLDEQFLPRLVAVFWAVFHPTEGPKVVYQVPDGAVVPQAQAQPPLAPPRLSSSRPASPRRAAAPTAAPPPPPLFDWAGLKDYLIPKEPLCGHLVTCLASASALEPGTPTHPGAYGAQAFKVLAYPVLMHDEDKYARNTFIFNLAFVFDAKSDVRAYEPVVRKCARTLRYLEDSKSFLSSPRSQPRMYGLIEQLYEDLNSYCETFIALPDAPHTRYLDKPGANNGGASGAARNMRGGAAVRNGRTSTAGQTSTPSSPFAGLPAGGLAMTRRRSSGGASASLQGKEGGANGVAMTPMSSTGAPDAATQELSAAAQAARLATVPPLHLGDPVLLNTQLAEAEAVMSGGGPATPLTKLRVADLALTAVNGSGTGSASTSPRPRVARANTVDLMSPLSTLSMRRSSLAPSAQSSDDEGGRDESKARITPSRSSSGDQALRPSLGRSKTLAALGFSGTTVSTMSASVDDNKDAGFSSGATTPAGETAPMLRAASSSDIVPGTPVPPSSVLSETGAADRRGSRERHSAGREAVKDGIMSLRTIGAATAPNAGGSVPAGAASSMTASSSVPSAMPLSTSVGALAPAPMLAPGKREPPHGLGRTVRDAINLKLFPTYANPPPVNDWDVPVALLDLKGKNEGNWDLTMAKIFPFIDGVNHVKRIAQLADADLELTRQCMEHLLFYSCIITLDIFAFSNMYSLRPAIAMMAEDESIQRECGAYVSRAGSAVPSWPKLLQLYSALRPGITLHDWIDTHDVDELGIDVRRFVTFGVIKGFLRRVHRYPILLAAPLAEERSTARSPVRRTARGTEGPQGFSTFSMIPGLEAGRKHASPSPLGRAKMRAAQEEGQGSGSSRERPALTRSGDTARPLVQPGESDVGSAKATAGTQEASGATPVSAAQSAVRPRRRGRREASENGSLLTLDASLAGTSPSKRAPGSARNVRAAMHRHATATVVDVASVALDLARPPEEVAPPTPGAQRVLREWKSNSSMQAWTRTLSGGIPSHNARVGDNNGSAFSRLADGSHAGAGNSTTGQTAQQPYVPPELGSLCDGTRPEDELCVRFGISWSELHQLLLILGRPAGVASTGGSMARERNSMNPGDSTWTLPPQQGTNAEWGEEEMANASGFTGASAIAYPGAQAGGTLGRRSVGNSTLAGASGFARPPNALRRHGSQEQNARGGARDEEEDGTSMGPASTAATNNWPSAVLAEATAAGDYGLIRIILQ